jgi:hypothetical protein
VPVSPTKSAMAGSTSKRGLLKIFAGIVGLSKKTISAEPEDLQTVEDAGEAERNQTITEPSIREGRALPTPERFTPRAESEMAKSTAFKSPSQASGSPNLGKRKRVSRRDLYEVEASPQGYEREEDPTNRVIKRPRHNIKGKPPLTRPKTSKSHNTSYQIRPTRGNNITKAGEMETTADVPASGPASGDKAANPIDNKQAKAAAKRGRGRPRKILHQHMRDIDVAAPKIRPTDGAVSNNLAPLNNSEAPEEAEEGVSDMLMNPSPVKVVRGETLPVATASKQGKVAAEPKDQNIEMVNRITVVEDEEGDEAEENQDVETEVEAEQEASNPSSNEPRGSPIDVELLDRMLERAKHVGEKFNTKEQNWSSSHEEKLWTVPGKRMNRQLKELVSGYEKLNTLKAARDGRGFRDARRDVENIFNLLRHEADEVLRSRFGTDCDTAKAKTMLTDLYFNTLPQIILAVKKGVQVYDDKGSMKTADIQEISNLVELLHDLASSAIKQPKEIQPRPTLSSSTYQISQPTRSNMPDIRSLQKMISVELRSREMAQKLAEEERLQPELLRRRREKEEREQAELLRKIKERHRIQGNSWWALKNNHSLDPWNQIPQFNITSLEAKSSSWRQEATARKGKGRQESVELGYSATHSVESLHHGDQRVERISMFPNNNINEVSRLKSVTKEDMSIFIDCMRYEQGKFHRKLTRTFENMLIF